MEIRIATARDSKILYEMLRALAEFQGMLAEFSATEETFSKILFDKSNNFGALLLEDQGQIVGMTVYYISFVTFMAGRGLFVEELFVPEQFRGRGYGKKLFKSLAQLAIENKCLRIELDVLKTNKRAIAFYQRCLNAKPLNDWVTYRMEMAEIQELAL